MAKNKLILVCLALMQTFSATYCATYQGCFEENQKQRQFNFNPGDYDPEAMNPDLCASKCGAYGYTYAALTYSRFCLCGTSAPAASAVDNSNCQEVCSGDQYSNCGGKTHVSLYLSSQPITGLTITSDASGEISIGTAVNFDVSITSGIDVHYKMDYDDGADQTARNATGFDTRSFLLPGTYSVRVHANDYNETLAPQSAVTTVTVKAPAADVDIECDPVFATYDEGKCVATVWKGNSMEFSAKILHFSMNDDFQAIADPVLSKVGPGIPSKDPLVSLVELTLSGVVLAPASLVQNPGRVISWELNAVGAGVVKVLILSPDCGATAYCVLTNLCSPACDGVEGVYTVSCSPAEPFCPIKRLCDDTSCSTITLFNSANPQVTSYLVKAAVDITGVVPGYQVVDEPTLVEVAPGDILALDTSGSSKPYWQDCTPEETNFKTAETPVVGGPINGPYNEAGIDDKCMMLRAIVSEGSRVYLPYTFNQEGDYVLDVSASNKNPAISGTPATNSTLVHILEGVNFTIIDGPIYLTTGVATTFTVEPHTGNGAVYSWDQGDGSLALVNISDQSKDLTYSTKGTYNLTVTTANAVSSKTNVSLIFVQDEVTGLDVTADTYAAANELHTFTITLTGGSDYTCFWNFGVGQTPQTTNETTTPPTGPTPYGYIFTATGDKTVNVTCINDVSSMTKTFTQQVQERITGVALKRSGQDSEDPFMIPWTAVTGSDIEWSVSIVGVSSLDVDLAAHNDMTRDWQTVSQGPLSSNAYNINITGQNDINTETLLTTYEVTTAIASFNAFASTDNTTTGAIITFTIDMSKGSNVNLTIVFDDGSVHSEIVSGDWTGRWTFDKSYYDGGRYTVQMSASNAAGTETETVSILVLQGLSKLKMYSPKYALYAPPSFVNVYFSVGPTEPAPTEPKLDLDFDYTTSLENVDLVLDMNYTERYNDIGYYMITAKVTNPLEDKPFAEELYIIDILKDAEIATDFVKAPKGQPFSVHFILFRGPQCPLCNLTWDFGEPADDGVTLRLGEGENGRDTKDVTFLSVGIKTITVTAASPLETLSKSKSIEVIEGFVDTDLSIIPDNANLIWAWGQAVKLTVRWTGGTPPDQPAYVDIHWGDGTVETALPYTTYAGQLYSRTFTDDGQSVTSVFIYNDASRVQIDTDTGVWKAFSALSASPCYTPPLPVGSGCLTGLPGFPGIFSNDNEFQFDVFTSNNAKAAYYTVEATNGGNTVVCNKTGNPFFLRLDTPGIWTTTVTAINPLHTEDYTFNVEIVEQVVGFNLTHDEDEKKGGVLKHFFVAFEYQGTNTCLMVDFGDGVKEVYTDDINTCVLDSDFTGLAASGPFPTASFKHRYTKKQTYTLKAIAKTQFNSITRYLSFEITNLDCSQPEVNIYNKRFDFKVPNRFKKGSLTVILGKSRITCFGFQNTKEWTVDHVDRDWGSVTGSVDLGALNVITNTSELRLDPWLLDYGLYRVTYKMSMDTGNPDVSFTGIDHSYFVIEESELIGLMVTGGTSGVVRGKAGPPLLLIPLLYSYDPDVRDNSPANSGMEVVSWQCAVKWPTPSTTCTWLAGAIKTFGTSGQLTTAMSNLAVDYTYTITVDLKKDTRSTQASLDVVVVAGDPPRVAIQCIAGSVCHQLRNGYRVLRSAKLGLSTVCENCNPGDYLTYNWTIYLSDYRWFERWRPLTAVEIGNERTVGSESKEISIRTSLFEEYNDYKLYKARCEVTRNGVTGFASIELRLNDPPYGGSCSITPTYHPVTEEKVFQIVCSGWKDDTQIYEYSFFSTFDSTSVLKQITTFKSSLPGATLNVTLVQGKDYLDYNNTVNVRVRDTMGAATEMVIDTVKVVNGSKEEREAIIEDILKNPNSELAKKHAEGDVSAFTEYTSIIGAVLNEQRKEQQKAYSGANVASTYSSTAIGRYEDGRTYSENLVELTEGEKYAIEKDRDDRGEVRLKITEYLADLPGNTVQARSAILSAMEVITKYTDEVPMKSQDVVLKSLEDFSVKLFDGEVVTPEARQEHMTYMLTVLINIEEAASANIKHGLQTELDDTVDDPYFMNFNVENTAEETTCRGLDSDANNIDAALSAHKEVVHCQLSTLHAKEVAEKARTIRKRLVKLFAANSVNGETSVSKMDRGYTVMEKKSAKNVFGVQKTLGYTNAVVQFPNVSDMFDNGNVDSESVVVLLASVTSNSALLSGESANNIPLNTRFLDIDISDSDGDSIPVKNMKNTMFLSIPRAFTTLSPKKVNPKRVSWLHFHQHLTETPHAGASLHAEICPEKRDVQYLVVVTLGYQPNNETCNKSFLVPPNVPVASDTSTCTKIFLDNDEVGDHVGEVYIGIRQLPDTKHNMGIPSCVDLPDWFNDTAEFTGNYTITIFTSACWSSTYGTDWITDGCKVLPTTDTSKTDCACNHLTTFAGGWVVVPNTIDWAYVFDNLDFAKNPTLYITQIIIVVVYIFALIWARRKDKKDVEQLGIAPLVDNDPKDRYYYEIVVVTGMRRNAGTDSKVFFILSGEDDETDVREFSDTKRKIFRRGATNGFLVSTPRPLGYLNYARIWHDNSGRGNMGGWYFNYMIVRDVQTEEKWVFIADRWFAVEEDDGQVDRIVPVATREAMTEFGHMFAERSRKNLADGHLWFSVVARPPQSRFTCVQRVSCCLCLLYASMMANAMFYQTDSNEEGASNGIQFGPFSLSPEQIFIGIAGNLVVFPINFVIIMLFRKARPRKLRPSRVDEAIKTAHDGPRTEASVNDVKPEVSSIFSVSRPSSAMNDPKPRPESSMSRPATSLSARADGSLPTKKKKKSFPWWCRIVGWVLLIVATVVSAAIVTAYGVTFQDEKVKKWISSMLVSFFMSVFITQPIKVFLVAIFLSLIVKNPGEEEEDEEEDDEERTKLANDEIPLHNLNPDSFGAARPRKIGYKPPDRKELDAARDKRIKEIKMWGIIREVIVYAFFLWILLVISYRQLNTNTFLYKDTMERVYIKNNETNIDFGKIRNVDEFWVWARSGLVNGIRAGPYYNNYPPLMLRGFVNDKVSKILGYATMRQLRIKPSLCEMDERMMRVIRECNIGYDMLEQEEGTFDRSWKTRNSNSTVNDTDPWYRYTHAEELDGYPYWGQLSLYAGGGYLVPLKGSKDDLIQVMHVLEQQGWIDRYTRAIFVEFTTYNAQVNLFGIATILAEFHRTGGVVQSYRFEPANLLSYMTDAMLFQLVCEGVYVLFILFFIFKLFKTLIKEKLSFFKSFWNLVEMGIIAMSVSAIVIYFYRLFETNKLTSRFKESNGLKYIKFQYVAMWNELFTYMIGWTVFFSTLKFMRLLRFNKRMSILASTLKNGARSLLHFSIIFWIVFLAFAMLFFLTFMTVDIKYSSFIGSVVSGILMMMGKFDIYTLSMSEPILSQVFVFLFVISVTFIIVNMFVSILNETFGAVRQDVSKQNNDYEVISFMVERFKRFTGIGVRPTTLTPEELRNREQEQRYAEGRVNTCVDDFPDRIDRLLHSISNVYMDQENLSAMMDKKGYQHGAQQQRQQGAKGGYDNMGYTGPKGRASELSKVHTH